MIILLTEHMKVKNDSSKITIELNLLIASLDLKYNQPRQDGLGVLELPSVRLARHLINLIRKLALIYPSLFSQAN